MLTENSFDLIMLRNIEDLLFYLCTNAFVCMGCLLEFLSLFVAKDICTIFNAFKIYCHCHCKQTYYPFQ
jgi:hypothetical protein